MPKIKPCHLSPWLKAIKVSKSSYLALASLSIVLSCHSPPHTQTSQFANMSWNPQPSDFTHALQGRTALPFWMSYSRRTSTQGSSLISGNLATSSQGRRNYFMLAVLKAHSILTVVVYISQKRLHASSVFIISGVTQAPGARNKDVWDLTSYDLLHIHSTTLKHY